MSTYLRKSKKGLSLAVAALFLISVFIPLTAAQAFNKDAIEEMKVKLNYKKDAAASVPADAQAPAALKKDEVPAPAAVQVQAQTQTQAQTPAALGAEPLAPVQSAPVTVIENQQAASLPALPEELNLVGSINFALENNRNIKSAEKGIKLADIKVREAKSKYEPQLSYQGVVTRMDRATVLSLGAMSVTMTNNVLQDHKVNYSQALYTSNRVEYGKLMAEKYKEAAVFAVDSARVNLVYMVKKGFYDLLLAKEFVKVSKESVELIAAHVQTVKNRFNAGTASKFDLLRVEVQEANTKPNLIKSVHGLTIAKNAFNNILARPIFSDIEIAGELNKSQMPMVDLESALTTAIATRDDIKASKSGLEAADASLKLARAGNKPTVALSGVYDKALGQSMPVDKYNETWNMSVVAQVPIYDGSVTKHSVESATTAYEQKKIDFDQLIENVKLEVKVAHQELIQADELITASEKNVEQAKEALSIAQVSYDNGLNTNLEIMDAQLALTQAKTNYFQSLHDYAVAFAKLEKSMGIARIAE